MTSYFDEFNKMLITQNSSANTIEAYERDITNFFEYIGEKKLESLSEFTAEMAGEYIDFLRSKGKAVSTITRNIASLRAFYKFLIINGQASSNPFIKLEVKSSGRKFPNVLTSNEVNLLLEQPDQNDYKGIRDKAMLETLYATGMRVTELIDLTMDDVNLDMGFVRCCNGEKERIIPLYPLAVKAIRKYLTAVRKLYLNSGDEKALFVNLNGDKLTRQGFWKILKKYQAMAGIEKAITPQVLRHSFAIHLLENGAEITDVKEMLGHCDLASTQVYTQLIKNKFKSSYTKFHPRA